MRIRDVRGTAAESLYDLATFVLGTFGFVLFMRLFGERSTESLWTLAVFQAVCLVYLGQYFRRRRAESGVAAVKPDAPVPTPPG